MDFKSIVKVDIHSILLILIFDLDLLSPPRLPPPRATLFAVVICDAIVQRLYAVDNYSVAL